MGYDRKLQHNVIAKLETILERYFLYTKIEWGKPGNELVLQLRALSEVELAAKEGLKPKKPNKNTNTKTTEKLQATSVITSKKLTYTVENEKESVKVNARSNGFCQNVESILQYKVKSE